MNSGHSRTGLRIFSALMVTLTFSACLACGASRVMITDRGGSFVRLDPDPTLKASARNSHPASLPRGHLRSILTAVTVEIPSGLVGGRKRGPLFESENVEFLLPAVTEALAKAEPTEWAVFYLRQSGRRLRREITTGAFAVKQDAVHLTVGHFRRTDIEGSTEYNMELMNERELRADPMSGVWDFGVRFSVAPDERWRPGDTPRILVFPFPTDVTSSSNVTAY